VCSISVCVKYISVSGYCGQVFCDYEGRCDMNRQVGIRATYISREPVQGSSAGGDFYGTEKPGEPRIFAAKSDSSFLPQNGKRKAAKGLAFLPRREV
jgi:hypothetical protein